MFRLITLTLLLMIILTGCDRSRWETTMATDRAPVVIPDLDGILIPPNIAPLNFFVKEKGERFRVVAAGRRGDSLVIRSRSGLISFHPRKWAALIEANAGDTVIISVEVQDKRRVWRHYLPLRLLVSQDLIDPTIVYRIMKPIFNYWKDVGIYQRDLTSFDEQELIHGRSFGCVNCHTFANNQADRFLVSTRSSQHGSAALIADHGGVRRIDSRFGYAAFHPSGRFLTYTDMRTNQFFHSTRAEIRDVIDLSSSLANFDVESAENLMLPSFSGKNTLETYPAWSPDGKTLYFCSAPKLWDSSEHRLPADFASVRYSLWKVNYDPVSGAYGAADKIVSSSDFEKSILMPRVSPDGRFVLLTLCDYGVFPAFQKSADLHLLETATGVVRRLSINSNESESWHSFSKNGRWIAFSSKRDDGVFTRIYISHFDTAGRTSKPFLLPRRNPLFYDSFLRTCSVPELVAGPVIAPAAALEAAARSGRKGRGETDGWRPAPHE